MLALFADVYTRSSFFIQNLVGQMEVSRDVFLGESSIGLDLELLESLRLVFGRKNRPRRVRVGLLGFLEAPFFVEKNGFDALDVFEVGALGLDFQDIAQVIGNGVDEVTFFPVTLFPQKSLEAKLAHPNRDGELLSIESKAVQTEKGKLGLSWRGVSDVDTGGLDAFVEYFSDRNFFDFSVEPEELLFLQNPNV